MKYSFYVGSKRKRTQMRDISLTSIRKHKTPAG